MGYMVARAAFVTHQSHEFMGVLTDSTVRDQTSNQMSEATPWLRLQPHCVQNLLQAVF